MKEFGRSLYTKNAEEARERCLAATQWFSDTMVKFRSASVVDRSQLELAAAAFFGRWSAELDRPRNFNIDHYDEDVASSIESSRDRTRDLDQQLVANAFDKQVAIRAREIVEEAGGDFDELSARERLFAQKLSARVERELMRLIVHELSQPHRRFVPEDELFSRTNTRVADEERPSRFEGGTSLREADLEQDQRGKTSAVNLKSAEEATVAAPANDTECLSIARSSP